MVGGDGGDGAEGGVPTGRWGTGRRGAGRRRRWTTWRMWRGGCGVAEVGWGEGVLQLDAEEGEEVAEEEAEQDGGAPVFHGLTG